MRTVNRSLVTLASVVLLAACASRPASRQDPLATTPARVWVVIENHEFADLQIFLATAGTRIRLGTVARLETRSFAVTGATLPGGGVVLLIAMTRDGALRLEAPAVTVQLSQVVTWRLSRASFGTSITVR